MRCALKECCLFFSQLDIKFLGAKTIEKIFKSGFNNILKIIGATKEELYTVEGFGKKTVDRIYDNMHAKLTNISLVSVLGASGIFGQGIGTRKLKPLFNEIPDILELYKNVSNEEMLSRIINVQGFSDKTALKIISGLSSAEQFRDRLMERGVTFSGNVVANANIQTTSPLSGTKIVFSGFRDTDLSKIIVDNGGQTTDSVSKNTTCVVVKIKGENTGKEAKAISLGIPVYTKEEFVNMYIH
jgi:NAD-dependent DNA ligase